MTTNKKFPSSKNFPYLPHSENDRMEMLKAIGISKFEDLVRHIPSSLKVDSLSIPEGMSEMDLNNHMAKLAAKNTSTSQIASFLGGGAYNRYVPSAVPAIVSRSEFATAYTPYQPEVSQGSLQSIYEFQSAICALTGMDVANASMYDGPTALAEACLMACRLNGRKKISLSPTLNPEYKAVTKTYLEACDLELTYANNKDGLSDFSNCNAKDISAYVVQYPNYFGLIEEVKSIAELAHQNGALLIVVSEPISLGFLETPGSFGADIVVGDAQPCGNYQAFGGPSAGYFACRQEYVRQIPGRIVGLSEDVHGNRAFTLTLQTREQHIRRAKATSNICTNQALNALTMLVYLSLIGPQGLREIAEVSMQRAHYLVCELSKLSNLNLKFKQPFLNEFLLTLPCPADDFLSFMQKHGILAGINIGNDFPELDFPDLKNCVLVCVTEMNSKEDLEHYIDSAKLFFSQQKLEQSAKIEAVCQ